MNYSDDHGACPQREGQLPQTQSTEEKISRREFPMLPIFSVKKMFLNLFIIVSYGAFSDKFS